MSDGGGDGDADDAQDQLDIHDALEANGTEWASHPVPLDIYGDSIMSIIAAIHVARTGNCHPQTACVMFTSLLLFIVNGIFQVGLSWMVYSSVVLRKESIYKDTTVANATHMIQVAQNPLPENITAVKLCLSNDVDFVPIYSIVVLLWFTRIVTEISEGCWLLYVTCMIPAAPPVACNSELTRPLPTVHGHATTEAEVEELSLLSNGQNGPKDREAESCTDDDESLSSIVAVAPSKHGLPENLEVRKENGQEEQTITWLPLSARLAILLLVTLPKMAIAFFIAILGAKFLEYTTNVPTLVLKVMTCVYFVSIDEMVFKAFVSTRRQQKMQKTQFRYTPSHVHDTWWINWGSAWFRITVVVSATCAIHFGTCGQLRGFRYACQAYKARFSL